MPNPIIIQHYFSCILCIDFTSIIMYYITIVTKQEETDMTRIEELEKILESVCGNYENDCFKCPRQKECDEFCKLEGIYEIINK